MTRATLLITPLMLLAVAAGCAKQPGTSTTGAPAPTAISGSTAAQPAVKPATSGPTTPSVRRGAATQPSGPSSSTGRVQEPFAPREYAASADLRDIHFDFDKAEIRPDAAKILDTNAGWLKANPRQLVLIEGHCDERGTNEYNIALGERRATAAKNYLVGQGVQAGRISLVSYGEERPACAEKNEACWAKNRRAAFLVKAQ